MSPLGGLMKIGLGALLGWAFVSGALSRLTDKIAAGVTGPTAPAAPAAARSTGVSS